MRQSLESLAIDRDHVAFQMGRELRIAPDSAVDTNPAFPRQNRALRARAKSQLRKRACDADFSFVLCVRQCLPAILMIAEGGCF